jgi:Kef-type K+ transport system membrane component KefB/mannitol/fructose-specific phosphotransferase system IIA component (Ntr-type)
LIELLQQIPLAPRPGPLLTFAIILIAGGLGGWIAKRCRLPSIIGNLMAGVAIGPYALRIVPDQETVDSLVPLSMFAIGLIMVSVGGHLSWHSVHNAWRRILSIAIVEVAVTISLVAFALRALFGLEWPMALLLGGLAGDTSPATIIHVCREGRAKGPFVKTLLSVVALDNILTITVFVVLLTLVSDFMAAGSFHLNKLSSWFHPGWIVVGSAIVGLTAGRVTEFLVHRPSFHHFTTVFIAILLTAGAADWLGMSPLLAGLFFGLFLSNASSEAQRQINTLDPLEWILFIAFFTMAGVNLHLDMLPQIGLMGAAFVVLRIIGKSLGAVVGGVLGGSSPRIWRSFPLALVPQSGVAIALVIRLQSDERLPADMRATVATLVLTSVVVNEFIGPISTRLALKRAGELGKGRARLVEFMQEEFIKTDLVAKDKWDAIRQLCDFLIRTHRVENIHPDELFQSVVERERIDTTAVGHGAAIPHGTIEHGPTIQGVLGISREGIDFDAPDGEKVRIVMLIATPQDHRSQHLKIMAALSAMISHPVVRSRIVAAPDANAVWEIIESEDTPGYNYFLEE